MMQNQAKCNFINIEFCVSFNNICTKVDGNCGWQYNWKLMLWKTPKENEMNVSFVIKPTGLHCKYFVYQSPNKMQTKTK